MIVDKQNTENLSVSTNQPFSWSYFRHQLFNTCKRAYFYYYYGSQNGWDKYAVPRVQLIHKLKNIKTIDNWIEDIFIKSIRELFIAPRKYMSKKEIIRKLNKIITNNINREYHQYTINEYNNDHTKLNLFEGYYEKSVTNQSLKEYAVSKLDDTLEKFTSCDIFDELCQVNYYQWKTYTPPIYAYIDRKQIWVSPTLIWRNNNCYNVLKIKLSKPYNDFPVSLGISAIYLAQRAHVHYDQIKSRKMFINNSVETFFGQCNIDDLINLIKTSSSEMLSLVSNYGLANESDFKQCREVKNCSKCNFQEVCNSNIK